METLEERFPFLFNKQADYNTNSPSYYDGLAKYNKVLQVNGKRNGIILTIFTLLLIILITGLFNYYGLCNDLL